MTRYRRSALSSASPNPRLACTPFMRDIGIALSVKFVLLGVLYYACFDDSAVGHAQPDNAAVAQAVLGVPMLPSKVRHDR